MKKSVRFPLIALAVALAAALPAAFASAQTAAPFVVEETGQGFARLQDAAGGSFPRTLSLEQQGRFAIGFYYQRCRDWPTKKNTDFRAALSVTAV